MLLKVTKFAIYCLPNVIKMTWNTLLQFFWDTVQCFANITAICLAEITTKPNVHLTAISANTGKKIRSVIHL